MTHSPDPRSLHREVVAAFEAAQSALNREDWAAVAAMCDPASLALFRRSIVQQFAPAERPKSLTVEQYRRMDPDMPLEAAEYRVAQHNRYWTNREQRLAGEFAGVPSIDVLLTLSPADLFARWLDGHSTRRQAERLAASGRISSAMAATRAGAPTPQVHYRAVGAVIDANDFAYVVYRRDVEWTAETHPDIARWLAELTEEESELTRTRPDSVQTAVCRRQPDGRWLFLADRGFMGVGRTALIARAATRKENDRPSSEDAS